MDKIYGFKKSDVVDFLNYYKNTNATSLTEVFNQYALISKKARGSIRNLYYAIVKKGHEDKEFCSKFLGGKPIAKREVQAFSITDEYQLIEQILINKANGKSVRSTVNELANGDQKIALRYQNKYRNAVRKKSPIINEVSNKLGIKVNYDSYDLKLDDSRLFLKLQKEINGLVERISSSTRKENQALREKVKKLELENTRLINLLYDNQNGFNIDYFKNNTNARIN